MHIVFYIEKLHLSFDFHMIQSLKHGWGNTTGYPTSTECGSNKYYAYV